MFSLFKKKKKEKVEFPYHYIEIVWTETAIHDGTLDEYNKEIHRIKGGKIVEIVPYTEIDLDALLEVYKIPFVDMTERQVDDFKFEEMDSLSGSFREVIN